MSDSEIRTSAEKSASASTVSPTDERVDKPVQQQLAGPPVRSRRLMPWLTGILVVLIVLVGVVWWFTPPELHGVLMQSPRQADDFTLIATTGEPIQLSDLRGEYVVLFFGYTFCPDICPTTLNDLAIMAEELGPARMDDVQVVMVSLDPERDTVNQLATYLEYFDPTFIGMTGTVEDIESVASQFGIFFEKHEDTGIVDHTGAVTIIDPEGYVRLIIPKGLDGPTGTEIAEDLRYLMRRG